MSGKYFELNFYKYNFFFAFGKLKRTTGEGYSSIGILSPNFIRN